MKERIKAEGQLPTTTVSVALGLGGLSAIVFSIYYSMIRGSRYRPADTGAKECYDAIWKKEHDVIITRK